MKKSNGACLLFKTFSHPLAMTKSCSGKAFGTRFALSPADSTLNPGGKRAALDISGCSGCLLGCWSWPQGCPASLGHQAAPWGWGWTRDGMGRHGKAWQCTAGPDNAWLFFSGCSPSLVSLLSREHEKSACKSLKFYSRKPAAISGCNNLKWQMLLIRKPVTL